MDLTELILSVQKNAEIAIPTVEGDYIGEDGLLYCGKCHTRKQTVVQMPFGEIRPKVLCLCQQAVEREETEAEKRAKKAELTKELREQGFPDIRMQAFTFESDDGENPISSVAKKYVENFKIMFKQGKGLLLFGGVGTGKTFISACICNALIDKSVPCLMTSFFRLSNGLSAASFEDKQKFIDSLALFRLVVIDDLSAERDTVYNVVHVFGISFG